MLLTFTFACDCCYLGIFLLALAQAMKAAKVRCALCAHAPSTPSFAAAAAAAALLPCLQLAVHKKVQYLCILILPNQTGTTIPR